jgi:hypothetical protein
MAVDRHVGFSKIAIISTRLDRFSRNFTEVILCWMDKIYETTATFQYEPKKNGKKSQAKTLEFILSCKSHEVKYVKRKNSQAKTLSLY